MIVKPPFNDTLPESWSYAFVERRTRQNLADRRWEIVHLGSESNRPMCYSCESLSRIRLKCAILIGVLPIYSLASIVVHLVRAPFSALQVFVFALEAAMNQPKFSTLTDLIIQPSLQCIKSVWMAARVPMYMFAMMCAAFYGLTSPLQGRAWCAHVDLHWKKGCCSMEKDLWMRKDESKYSLLMRVLTDRAVPHFSMTPTFHPYPSLNDDLVLSIQFPNEPIQ